MKISFEDFITTLKLERVTLISLDVKKRGEYPSGVKVGIREKLREKHVILPENRFGIDICYKLEGYAHQDEVESKIFTIDLVYRLTYQTDYPGGITPKNLKLIKCKTAKLNIWPFIRHTVLDLTSEMGLPPVMIRLMSSVK